MLRHFLLIAAVFYPFGIYFGLNYLSPATLGSLLAVVVLLRVLLSELDSRLKLAALLAVLALVGIYQFMQNDQQLLKFYPVAVNSTMMLVFGGSLFQDQPLIENIALARGQQVGDHNRQYLRNLTIIWTLFFLVNTLVSGWTALYASMEVWLFYNGFLSYLLTGLLVVGELVYRRYHKRKLALARESLG